MFEPHWVKNIQISGVARPIYVLSKSTYRVNLCEHCFEDSLLMVCTGCHLVSSSLLLSSLLPQIIVKSASELTEKPNAGCYIQGLFLEGARWDHRAGQLSESRPKELHTEMSIIWLVPKPNRIPPTSGVYICPIYKTLTRAG